MSIDDLIFTGFNNRVAALHRLTGEIVWRWLSPQGTGYVTLILDGDLLVVSVQGYMFGLDALTGKPRWNNEMKGFGTGVTSLASRRGTSAGPTLQAAASDSAQQTHAHVPGSFPHSYS